MTASWVYDANNQLLQVCNATPTNIISQYDYTYDAAGRRVACDHSGSAFDHADHIHYSYNIRNELTNAVAAVDSDYCYAYGFDEIGNRETSYECGTNHTYTANRLNQYAAITDVAAKPSSSQPFQPQFDNDGNQTLIKTATGIWSATYNGKNRPVFWKCVSPNISTPTFLVMSYDRKGRRVTKNNQRFVYNGYLQIAKFEQETSNIKLQTFIWDPTEPILTRPLVSNCGASPVYYVHDGNKNVSEVVAENGNIAAHYEYAPFGAVTMRYGTFSVANPWRFSSEFAEDDTAMVYYNYRHYEPMMGKWLRRDLIGERGGVNLFLFAKNALGIDFLGNCEVGKVRNAKFTFEYATDTGNGIDIDEMIDAYDNIQIFAWLSIGAGVGSGAAAGAAGGLAKACCQGITTGADEGAGLAASDSHDTNGAVDMCKKLAKILASAHPRIRGSLTYEECVCKKFWFISYTTWAKKTIGPSPWHDLVGGVNSNDGWFAGDVFETEEEAKENIKNELLNER